MQIKFTFGLPSLQNPGCIHCCRNIFQATMGRGLNELRNAAGFVFKLRIIVAVQDLKISFYTQISVLPTFGWCPLTSFALATALQRSVV